MQLYVLVNATLLQRVCADPKVMLKPTTAPKGEKAERCTGKQQVQCQLSSLCGYLAGSDGSLLIFGALSSAQLRQPGVGVLFWGLWSASSCRKERQQLNQVWWPETIIFMTVEELNL